MKDKITITHDEFRDAIADEAMNLMSVGDKVDANPMTKVMSTLLVTTFGAALASRLFKDEEEEKEDGAGS